MRKWNLSQALASVQYIVIFYGKMLLVRKKLSLIGWTVSIDTHNGNKRDELRARIFKCLWSPGIDSKK